MVLKSQFEIMINKKAVSAVITTILLILISILAVLFIAGVIMPFVRDNLNKGKECFDTMDQLKISTESGYTCYYNEGSFKTVNITIKRGQKEVDIPSFKISVIGEGKNNLFEIKEGSSTNVRMLSGSQTLELPNAGEERTYSLTTNLGEVLSVEVYPIVKSGQTCDLADKAEIQQCSVL